MISNFIEYSILPYFVIINFIYLTLAIYSIYAIFSQKNEIEANNLGVLLKDEELPSLSIIVPAYNESSSIVFCVQTLLNLAYRKKNLIVVNDGSTDDTFEILRQYFRLMRIHMPHQTIIETKPILGYYKSLTYPNLTVVNKKNGKKADATNAGINVSNSDFAIIIDADTLIDSTEMNRMIRYLITHPDVEAAGASVRVANNCKVKLNGITEVHLADNSIAAFQTVEYLRAFLIGRAGWDLVGGALIISGAFTFINLEKLKEIGGYDTKTLGEDMELILRYKKFQLENHLSPYTAFLSQPVSWTEVPEDLKTLSKQRMRWQLGLMQVLWKHREVFFNPSYGVLGMFIFPFFVFGEMLSPFVELLGYIFIIISLFEPWAWMYALLFLGLSFGITTLVNLHAIALEQLAFHKYTSIKDIFRLIGYAFLENFGYRQMILWWRLKAAKRILFKETGWDVVSKMGFQRRDKKKSS